MTLLAKCCCNLTAICCVDVTESARLFTLHPCNPGEACNNGETCALSTMVLTGGAYVPDSGGVQQHLTCGCIQYSGSDNRWYGTGDDGESWQVWLSDVEYNVDNCPQYRVLRLRITYDGNDFQWLAASLADGDCVDNEFEFSTSNPDLCAGEEGIATCCQDFEIACVVAAFPFVSGGEPESFEVTIAGATGACCSPLNATHTLDFNSSDLNYEFACANRSNGVIAYEKDLAAEGACGLRRIVLLIATNDVAIGFGSEAAGDCELFVQVLIEGNAGAASPCFTVFNGRVCPIDPDNIAIDLSTLTQDYVSNCPDGTTDCDLTNVTLSGTIAIAI